MTNTGIPNYWTRIACNTYSGGSYSITHTLDMAIDKWYHVVVGCDHGVTGGSFIRVYDENGGSTTTATGTLKTSTNTGLLTIGTRSDPLESSVYMFDGLLDEIVVFKRLLTVDEGDQIRQGTFGPEVGSSVRDWWWWRRRHGN